MYHIRFALLAVLLVAAPPVFAQSSAPDSAAAAALHRRLITVDAHLDIPPEFNSDGNDPGREIAGQFDLPKLERGNLDVAVVALFANPAQRTPENRKRARDQFDSKLQGLQRFVSAHPDRLAFVRSADEIEQVAAAGRHGILLSVLNTLALKPDTAELVALHQAGVRLFGFSHVGDNDWAHSSRPNAGYGDTVAARGGLTALGPPAVGTLNRLGILIDVSQLTPAGVFDVLRLSRAPVIASHSALRSRVDVTRNLSVAEARAIAERGGVVHIVAFGAYLRATTEPQRAQEAEVLAPFGLVRGDDPATKLSAEDLRKYQAAAAKFSATNWRFWSIEDYLDTIDAAVRLLGIDHVGLSSDFNHGGGVTGFTSVGDGENVTRGLLRRGYTEQEIAKLWSGNFLRVLREAEATGTTIRGAAQAAS